MVCTGQQCAGDEDNNVPRTSGMLLIHECEGALNLGLDLARMDVEHCEHPLRTIAKLYGEGG